MPYEDIGMLGFHAVNAANAVREISQIESNDNIGPAFHGSGDNIMDVAILRMAMRAMADRETNAHDLAKRLGITTTTLYMYVNGDGSVKEPGQKLLDAAGVGTHQTEPSTG